MANGFEPLNQAGFGSLMQMLENIQRQGAIQKAAVGPTLGQGIEGMLGGFERQGDMRRESESATERQRMGDAARARQATVDYNRQRGMDREERGFKERLAKARGTAGPNYDKLIIDLEGKIAEGKPYGTDTSGLERELARLRGLRGDGAAADGPEPFTTPMPHETPQEEERRVKEALGRIAPELAPPPAAPVAVPRAIGSRDHAIAYVDQQLAKNPSDAGWLRKKAQFEAERAAAVKRQPPVRAMPKAKSPPEKIKAMLDADGSAVFSSDPKRVPSTPAGKLMKWIAIDIQEGITDPKRLYQRAADRLEEDKKRVTSRSAPAQYLAPPKGGGATEIASATPLGGETFRFFGEDEPLDPASIRLFIPIALRMYGGAR